MKLTIATRQSALALWQAEHVAARLRDAHSGLTVELLPMTTQGDQRLETSLAKVGGKGLFVKELERALLDGRADLAVHSMKDVPAEFPEGLGLSAILKREDPLDAFVSNRYASLTELPLGACIGTASLRRQSQLLARRGDLKIGLLRGNVNTRLAKLDTGEFDGIILACAGLKRLQMAERIRERIDPGWLLPSVGQGAIGIESRLIDTEAQALIAALDDEETTQCVTAERAFGARLGGSCQLPLAAFAQREGNNLSMSGRVIRPNGSELIAGEIQGPVSQAASLGTALAERLLAEGADVILRELDH